MEPGFLPSLVDFMIAVPDAASVAAARTVRAVTRLSVGGSTGTNLWGALHLVARMRDQGARGTVVSLVCDAAERHVRTYHDDAWTAQKNLNPAPYATAIDHFLNGGPWAPKPTS